MFPISEEYFQEQIIIERLKLLKCDVTVLLSQGVDNSQSFCIIVDQIVLDHVWRQKGFAISCS